MTGTPSFVLVDYETTGLDAAAGLPLELAMLVLNDDLDILAQHQSLIVPPTDILWDDLAEVSPKVVEMHTKSGLRAAITEAMDDESAPGLFEVEQDFMEFLIVNEATGLPMCGSSVQFDRGWMRVHQPDLESRFHYRNIDISTVKELCRRYNPSVFAKAPVKNEKHRSLADCLETREELGFYLDNFLFVRMADAND